MTRSDPLETVAKAIKKAAWYYPHPSPLARKIKNHVALLEGVEVTVPAQAQAPEESGAGAAGPGAASSPQAPPG